jgi:type I restriction enzyme S subunit
MREPTNIARAVARIRPNLEKIVPSWLCWRLQNEDCQNTFAQDAREVARKTLNISLIKDVKLAVPTLREQMTTAKKIDIEFAWIDRLAAEATSARRLVDHLDQAVFAKGFRGELALQDPNDEPASVLLERMKASGEGADAPRRMKRPKTNSATAKKSRRTA